MSSTFPESIIDALRLAGHKIGLGGPVTWPWSSSGTSAGVTAAALAGALVFFHFVYHRPGKRSLSSRQQQPTKSSTNKDKRMPHTAVKPQDGSVKVAEILIHPIKSEWWRFLLAGRSTLQGPCAAAYEIPLISSLGASLSCRGTYVQSVKYTPQGLENDRKWCIIDASTNTVITAREAPRMVLISPRIEADPASPHGGALVIAFPSDAPAGCTDFRVPLHPSPETLQGWDIIDKIGIFHQTVDGYVGQILSPSSASASDILSLYFGKPVHLVYKGPRAREVDTTHAFPELKATSVFQDMYPVLVLSKESMGEVERELRGRIGQQGIAEAWREAPVELRRFRPNIVFEGGGPFAEDNWEEVTIGRPDAPLITLVSKCARCLLPNVSPDTGERDKAVPYKVIMKFRTGLDPIEMMKPCVGCNGVPAANGEVSVGDIVATPSDGDSGDDHGKTTLEIWSPVHPDAKKFGLENFCNNCYANSVIQALYFCTPFRDLMLQSPDASLALLTSSLSSATSPGPSSPPPLAPVRRKPERKPSTAGAPAELELPPAAPIPAAPPSLFSALRSLFSYISTHPAERGTVSPRAFIDKLKEVNQVFNTTTHQDAHEFLNYLLNKIVEEVEEDRKLLDPAEDLSNSLTTLQSKTPTIDSTAGYPSDHATLVHKLFEGVLTSETRCLTCETVSSRDESFLDLSIDIEQNSSVTACLRQFSASEMLCHTNKFFCDSCCDLQEAEKRMKIKRLPNVLALHLKRFKYQEDLQKYVKLAYRVAFPFELRLFNTVDEMDEADRLYNLFGIVVHIGNGPHHGHYVSIIKTLGTWLLFDDDTVSPVPESEIPKYFGDSPAGSAYVLYYQAADIDPHKLGLRAEQSTAETTTTASTTTSHSNSQPARPPGLVSETTTLGSPPIAMHTPSSSASDINSSSPPPHPRPPPPSSFPLASSTSPPIPIMSPTSPSAPSLATITSTSSRSTSTSLSTPTSAASSPPSTSTNTNANKVATSVNNIFKTIRKSPSISIRTNTSAHASASPASASASASAMSATTPTALALPPPVLPTPTKNGLSSPRQFQVSTSGSSAGAGSGASGSGRETRPATAHAPVSAPRTLPVLPPPLSPRPATSAGTGTGTPTGAGGGGEDGRDKERDGKRRDWEKEKEVLADVDPNTSTSVDANAGPGQMYGNGSANGPVKKEKDKSWFGGKRKSFRIGEKALKGLVGAGQDATDMPPPSPIDNSSSAATWFRTSLQLPQRRGSESGDAFANGQAPGGDHHHKARPHSSGKHRPRPSSTNLKQPPPAQAHLHPHAARTSVNGEVSPAPSSSSSFDSASVSIGNSTPTSAVHSPGHHSNSSSVMPPAYAHPPPYTHPHPPPHPLPSPPTNGSRPTPPPPPPRLLASVSTPPIPITPAPTSGTPGFPHTRTLPEVPVPVPSPPLRLPVSPERKKSLASFPAFRSRDKEREKPKEKVWDAVEVPRRRPATAGGEVGRERERREREREEERPLPPVPVPVSVSVSGHEYGDGPPRRQGSGNGHGGEQGRGGEGGEQKVSPGLVAYGSANTSVASGMGVGGGGGGGNLGFKRATRKLSLTAPMLGFGKKDKEKDKEKEKLREKAVPSAFTWA
ncbi:hypothetical protein D9615_001042 [Tricholomella constricta]|uniref:ubiquitinyl hydrolase 1 n=1 Tax=Tricholomella constricta TaxID=117010 RepID=A0A8H5M8V2_9AGAR|nr:hypothetical protein D9615_001042 [Tricholomella constricta]